MLQLVEAYRNTEGQPRQRVVASLGNATQSVGGTVIDGVLLDEIQTEQVVELGPQLVAMKAWDALEFSPMLQNLGMNPTAIATAQVMVSNRLIEPLIDWVHYGRYSEWREKFRVEDREIC